ncbi:MAG: tyrosine--tRNA ligase [Candidatus Moranbacteria bacterium]|nr:tyrosine--tRNA ligase [Candidatus Moranbacteria bacterium]
MDKKELEKKVDEILERGADEIIGKENLRKKLLSGEKLRIKFGIDPTSSNLHLGRAVPLLKLLDFQKLGHQIVLLVGNATGVIGDTSDKDSERPMLTHEMVEENMKSYKEQAAKILDIKKVEVVYNADWLDKLSYKEIGEHADCFSVHEFISRDNIKKRLDAGKRVSLREVLYPLMQGYDSVAVRADVELGGTDQRFNLLAGRTLQGKFDQEPQDIIMTNIISGMDGRKMSSSWGNTINLTDPAREMGEKIMNMPDDVIEDYFVHCTRIDLGEVAEILKIEDKRKQKIKLAQAIISIYYDEKIAGGETEFLRKKFIEKNVVDDVEKFKVKNGESILDFLVNSGGANSKGDARRKIEQGGVSIDGEKVSDVKYIISENDNEKVLKVGKKFFRKIIIS